MKIIVVTLTFNEETILPFFLKHYHFASKIIIFDSGSTDRTVEIAKRCPLVELRDRTPTHGAINDGENVRLKNEAWKNEGADWVMVVDCDEFLWHPSIPKLLQKCDRHGWTIVDSEAYEMVGTAIPENGLLTDQVKTGVRSEPNYFMDKALIFKPCANLHYDAGCHGFTAAPDQRHCPEKVRLLHYKWLSRAHVNRKSVECVLSEDNQRAHWGFTGDKPSSETWSWRYRRYLEEATELEFLKPMKVNFIVTAHARQDYLLPIYKVFQSYRKIQWNLVVVASDMPGDARLTRAVQLFVKNLPNDVGGTGWSTSDHNKTQTGYNHFRNLNRNDFRFVKLGIDCWLCDEQIIIDIFNDMEYRRAGYAGNKWKEDEPSLSTDIFFADTRFGNVFKDFHCEVPGAPVSCFEWWMGHHCKRKAIATKIIPERIPVHPGFRYECEPLRWTMQHELGKNIANAERWGAL